MYICLVCVIHNANMHMRSSSARIVVGLEEDILMYICLVCVIHNANMHMRSSSARIVGLEEDQRFHRLVQTGSEFGQNITHR